MVATNYKPLVSDYDPSPIYILEQEPTGRTAAVGAGTTCGDPIPKTVTTRPG